MELNGLEFKESLEAQDRAKTSLKMLYEAQAQVISRQIGGLEGARQSLGLSRRKISQLLLVDPSAWTRWTKGDKEQAPPHVYRALQWYLALFEKIPGLTPEYFLGKHYDPNRATLDFAQNSILEKEIHLLRIKIRRLERVIYLSLFMSLVLGLSLFFVLS